MPSERVPTAVLVRLCPLLAGMAESVLGILWRNDCAPEGREAQGLPAGKEASQMYKANSGKLAGALEGSWGIVAACLQPSWL